MDMVVKARDLEHVHQQLVRAGAALVALNSFATKLVERLKEEGRQIDAGEASAWQEVQGLVAEAGQKECEHPVQRTEVHVEHWNSPCYGGSAEEQGGVTYPMEVVDMRAGSGQLLVSVGTDNGSLDDVLSVAFEVTCGIGSKTGAPSASVYDGDEQLVRLFKHPNGVLVEPIKPGVKVMESKLANGEVGWMVVAP